MPVLQGGPTTGVVRVGSRARTGAGSGRIQAAGGNYGGGQEIPGRLTLTAFNRFGQAVDPAAQANALLQRILARRAIPGERTEASITWGKASDILIQEPESVPLPGLSQGGGNDPNDGPLPVRLFTEISRETNNVRVENPDDSEQYVIVARISSVVFSGPDGYSYQFNYNPPD